MTTRYQTETITIAAGAAVNRSRSGIYVSCLSSPAAFRFALDDEPLADFEQGLTVVGDRPFSKIRMRNPSGGPITVQLAYGRGEIVDSRLTVSAPLNLTKATTLDTVADVLCPNLAATVVAAALATRRRALIQNVDPVATVRIGDASVTATRGLRLGPGERIVFETTEAISVRNDSGSTVPIAVAWEAD